MRGAAPGIRWSVERSLKPSAFARRLVVPAKNSAPTKCSSTNRPRRPQSLGGENADEFRLGMRAKLVPGVCGDEAVQFLLRNGVRYHYHGKDVDTTTVGSADCK